MSGVSPVSEFDHYWTCRAEGQGADGKLSRLDYRVSVWRLKQASAMGDEKLYRRSIERNVLVGYFHETGRVPYRIYWELDGREWLEPIPRPLAPWVENCDDDGCYLDGCGDCGMGEVGVWVRDTRDWTTRG